MVVPLDSDLDRMEEMRFRKKHGRLWQKIMKDTHFNYTEIQKIMLIFYKMQKRDEKLYGPELVSRANFRDVLYVGLGMTDTNIMERVMVALDRGVSPYVSMETFAKALSLYLRGTLEERIKYAFTCYDLLGEGMLRRSTMYQLLKRSMSHSSHEDDVEAVKELVDTLLKRMDVDLDGVISFKDFRKSVLETPTMLECLGYCLPKRPSVHTFLATWSPNWVKM